MTQTDRLSIFYVDDDDDIRHIVKLSLALDPLVELRAFARGEAALWAAQREQWQPDIVLLDVMMPGMDGPSLMRELRTLQHFETLPFVFLTARARLADIETYKALGAADVILKPFDPIALAKQLHDVVRTAKSR